MRIYFIITGSMDKVGHKDNLGNTYTHGDS